MMPPLLVSSALLRYSTFRPPPFCQSQGEISRVLITLDAIIADNQSIAVSWAAYKRMIKYVRADPTRYGLAADKLKTVCGVVLWCGVMGCDGGWGWMCCVVL
jgi:hypothetical protein